MRRQALLARWSEYLQHDLPVLENLVVERLVAQKPPLLSERQGLRECIKGLAAQVQKAAASPFETVPIDPQPAREAFGSLVKALRKQRDDPRPPMDAQQMDKALDGRRYFDALRAIPRFSDELLSDVDKRPTVNREGADAKAQTPELPESKLVQDTPHPAPAIDAAALALMRARSVRQLVTMQWLQTLIVALVVLGVSCALFGERFIGTPVELMGLFFGGFTTDLSVVRLLELAPGWAAKPKA